VRGILGEGVAATTRPDPQAKSLGEFLRSREVALPRVLVADVPAGPDAAGREARAAEGAW